MESDPIITISDIRPLFCARGVRRAFEDAGLDFQGFIRHGMRASALRGVGYDAMLDRILEAKQVRQENGRL